MAGITLLTELRDDQRVTPRVLGISGTIKKAQGRIGIYHRAVVAGLMAAVEGGEWFYLITWYCVSLLLSEMVKRLILVVNQFHEGPLTSRITRCTPYFGAADPARPDRRARP